MTCFQTPHFLMTCLSHILNLAPGQIMDCEKHKNKLRAASTILRYLILCDVILLMFTLFSTPWILYRGGHLATIPKIPNTVCKKLGPKVNPVVPKHIPNFHSLVECHAENSMRPPNFPLWRGQFFQPQPLLSGKLGWIKNTIFALHTSPLLKIRTRFKLMNN